MALLLKLNDLRPQIQDIRNEAEETFQGSEDEIATINTSLEELSAALDRSISLIEKHYSDERTMDIMERDLRRRMAEEPIFEGVSEENKNTIVEKVIADPDTELINEDELKDHITNELKNASTTELITKAYSKSDIVNLGDAVVKPGSSETKKYDHGLEILRNMVETPTGREDALTYGLKRLMEDSQSRLHYIFQYYSLGSVGEPTEEPLDTPEEPTEESTEEPTDDEA